MDANTGKILVVGSAVAFAGMIAVGVVHSEAQDIEPVRVYLPAPTITETVHHPVKVPIPGPTVTKKVVETKTVRPKIPREVSRSNERKKPPRVRETHKPAVSSGNARSIAQSIFGSQFSCADALITRESGWNVYATNPSSGAYGLGQALPGSKMAPYGSDWRTNPATQLRWMQAYVNGRYGGACAAWEFWKTHHYY